MADTPQNTTTALDRSTSRRESGLFLTSFESKQPYYKLYITVPKSLRTDTIGGGKQVTGTAKVTGENQPIIEFEEDENADLLEQAKEIIDFSGDFADLDKYIHDSIVSIDVTRSLLGAEATSTLTVSYNVAEKIRQSTSSNLLPYPLLRLSMSAEDQVLLVSGYRSLPESERKMRIATYSKKQVQKTVSNGQVYNLTRAAIKRVTGKYAYAQSDRAISFVGLLGPPTSQGDVSGNVTLTYELIVPDALPQAAWGNMCGKPASRLFAAINKDAGTDYEIGANTGSQAPQSSDGTSSSDSEEASANEELIAHYPLSGTQSLFTIAVVAAMNCGLIDYEKGSLRNAETIDSPDTDLSTADAWIPSSRVTYDPKSTMPPGKGQDGYYNNNSNGLLRFVLSPNQPNGRYYRSMNKDYIVFQNISKITDTRSVLEQKVYKRFYRPPWTGESALDYMNSILKNFGYEMVLTPSINDVNLARSMVIQPIGVGAQTLVNPEEVTTEEADADSSTDALTEANNLLPLSRYGFHWDRRLSNEERSTAILFFQYGFEVMSYQYKINAAPTTSGEGGFKVTANIDGDYYDFQIDKEAIKAFYDSASSDEAAIREALDMATTNPDGFIVKFTKIIGKPPGGHMPVQTPGGGGGVEITLTLRWPIPGLFAGFQFAFMGRVAGLLPPFIEGIYECKEVKETYSADENILTQELTATRVYGLYNETDEDSPENSEPEETPAEE